MKIAVIGGSGFLGTHLISELIRQGHEVRLIKHLRNSSTAQRVGAGSGSSGGSEVWTISLDDAGALQNALLGCHSVAYLSGINREPTPGDFQLIHVTRLGHVIAAVKSMLAGTSDASSVIPKKIIYTSFLKARPSQNSQYLNSKYEGEKLLQQCGLDYTIFKPGICFGRGDQMTNNIIVGLKLLPLISVFGAIGVKETTMRPISAKDMSVLMTAALTENRMSKQTIPVVGPEEITLSKAARRVAAVMRRKLLVVHFPGPLMYALAWTLEKLSPNALVTVSQVRMLADGLSTPEYAPDPLPDDLLPKTYFREQEIQEVVESDQVE